MAVLLVLNRQMCGSYYPTHMHAHTYTSQQTMNSDSKGVF